MYQRVENVSFLENFVCELNGWPLSLKTAHYDTLKAFIIIP